jgi:hypothetical protein
LVFPAVDEEIAGGAVHHHQQTARVAGQGAGGDIEAVGFVGAGLADGNHRVRVRIAVRAIARIQEDAGRAFDLIAEDEIAARRTGGRREAKLPGQSAHLGNLSLWYENYGAKTAGDVRL